MSDLKFMPKVIAFDLDGTLVDTMGAYADIAANLISEYYGIEREKARSEYLRTSGNPFFKQLNALFPRNEKNAEIAAQFEISKLDVRHANGVDSDTRAALHELKKKYKLAISSNNYEKHVIDFVQNEKLPFDFCLGYKTGVSSKGRKHFQFLSTTLNIKPEDIVFIGDSLNDAKVALEFGAKFVAKLGTFAREDFHKIAPQIHCIEKISHCAAPDFFTRVAAS